MDTTKSTSATIADQVAQVAKTLQQQRTGHAPKAVTVVLGEDTLVITMHDALTPAEKALALNSIGASQVQEFHRQLFLASADALREEIKRITGRDVREAAAEIVPATEPLCTRSQPATLCRCSCSPRLFRPKLVSRVTPPHKYDNRRSPSALRTVYQPGL